ncbi:hypothetical protein EXIGLDRAFT_775934 [Exidia glandulosa HHB12029]|uniref:Uncharacterized protein n=1 Tax=Exidia glandulosa HHB12029 TaxID=1314781 RepID=A0A165DPK6_EXIGL|nr:hypothetical protein EXIGLDRAFT_775934 [Exidia glandulosa HHB12029]
MCFTSAAASYAITVDGARASATSSSSNSPCEQSGAQNIFVMNSLSPGVHTIKLVVTFTPSSPDEFRFFGGGITLSVATPGNGVDDSTVIDDQDADWMLVPGRHPGSTWDTGRQPGYHDGTVTFNCLYSPFYTASYKFTGAVGVVLAGSIGKDDRAFSVAFDSKVYNMDATSRWEDNQTVYFATGNLDPLHTYQIAIASYNSDLPDCPSVGEPGGPVTRACCVGFDYLMLLKAKTR